MNGSGILYVYNARSNDLCYTRLCFPVWMKGQNAASQAILSDLDLLADLSIPSRNQSNIQVKENLLRIA